MATAGKKLDLNQLAKRILDKATGETDRTETPDTSARKAASRKGGLSGGRKRMESLTDDQKRALALKAAESRWARKASADEAGAGLTKRSVKKL